MECEPRRLTSSSSGSVICEMWSVTGHSGYHSLISLSVLSLCVCVRPGLSDSRYPEEDRHGGLVSRVAYDDYHHYPRTRRVVVRRKIIRPRHSHRPAVVHHSDRPPAVVPVESLHPAAGHEGSYVAVSGSPGRGSVHVVDNVAALGRDSLTVVNGVAVRSRHGSRTALVPVAPAPVAHPSVLAPAPAIAHTPVGLPAAAAAPAPAPSKHENGDVILIL